MSLFRGTIQSWFEGRRLVVATKHGKEQVIGPLLKSAFSLDLIVPRQLDTDQFGTFTGEINRVGDPLSTARRKAHYALEITGLDLALASEGSFGPHPFIPFATADEEFLILVDRKFNHEIVARKLSADTNYAQKEIKSYDELVQFAESVGFPQHAMILRDGRGSIKEMIKGIKSWDKLRTHFDQVMGKYGQVYVETDMRAMNNPSRQKVIQQAMALLVEKIKQQCPNCHYPGFAVVDHKTGLPCELCGNPTKSVIAEIWGCLHCDYEQEKPFPNEKETEDPGYCDFCNP